MLNEHDEHHEILTIQGSLCRVLRRGSLFYRQMVYQSFMRVLSLSGDFVKIGDKLR